jgi:probable F420-dependent oxidoreductase
VAGPTGRGVWSFELRYSEPSAVADAAAELESLGYTAAWVPDVGGDLFTALDNLLGATSTMTIASGILNVWYHTPAEVATWWDGLTADRRGRVLLGVGISHGPLIGERWRRPLAVMDDYLDGLDAAGIPQHQRCLAALGPKMLELARERSAGAHPYLVTPEHTEFARSILGEAGLFVEQGVVFRNRADEAREIARNALDGYVGLPNYANNWKRFGFTDDEIASKTDRFVDALVAWGDLEAINERVEQHYKAGADHVCIQVLDEPGASMNRAAWRALAPAREARNA